jgi:hypothetical protein
MRFPLLLALAFSASTSAAAQAGGRPLITLLDPPAVKR